MGRLDQYNTSFLLTEIKNYLLRVASESACHIMRLQTKTATLTQCVWRTVTQVAKLECS